MRAGRSYGHDSIQHVTDARRLIPANGPGLHPSMYRDFLTTDDASAAARREPGRVTERSES
ncbi:hypothetical protein IQ64_45620 [Streptomyces stelliscabiei]|nr:hypothetical protein IQ64_45620 [Streptomyces stelliscabiei]